MARLSKFDKEIKKQMQGLQGEPSARVWAGIREATPTSGSSPWLFRSAAAILLLGILASGAWYLSRGGVEEAGDLAGGNGVDSVQQDSPRSPAAPGHQLLVQEDVGPDDASTSEQDGLAVDVEEKDEELPSQPDNSRISPMPALENQGVVHEATEEVQEEVPEMAPIKEMQVPKDILPQEFPVETPQEEVIAEENPVVPAEEEEEAPEEIQGAQPENSRPTRRQYALSDLKNISKEDVRKKSGAVLGNLALNASEAIGIKTEVERESIDDEHDKKKFAAHIGPISFKRVRKVKK